MSSSWRLTIIRVAILFAVAGVVIMFCGAVLDGLILTVFASAIAYTFMLGDSDVPG